MYGFCASAALPRTGVSFGTTPLCARPAQSATTPPAVGFEIRAAKHAQKKATKKHNDRRPKKKRPSDKYRKPPAYCVEPLRMPGLPPEYTVVEDETDPEQVQIIEELDTANKAAEAVVAQEPVVEEPVDEEEDKTPATAAAAAVEEVETAEPEAVVAQEPVVEDPQAEPKANLEVAENAVKGNGAVQESKPKEASNGRGSEELSERIERLMKAYSEKGETDDYPQEAPSEEPAKEPEDLDARIARIYRKVEAAAEAAE